MVKRLKRIGVLLCIIGLISLIGCSKIKDANNEEMINNKQAISKEEVENYEGAVNSEGIVNNGEITILGVDHVSIKQITLKHKNYAVYYDLLQDYQVEFINKLSLIFDNTAKEISTLEESLGITLDEDDVYINGSSDYFIQIEFISPQTIYFKDNNKETQEECDSILFNLNDLKLYWSKNKEYIGTLGYTSNEKEIEASYLELKNEVIRIFSGFIDQTSEENVTNNQEDIGLTKQEQSAKENQEYFDKVTNNKAQYDRIENQEYTFYYDADTNVLIYAEDKNYARTFYFKAGECIIIITEKDSTIGPTDNNYKRIGKPIYLEFIELLKKSDTKANELTNSNDQEIGDITEEASTEEQVGIKENASSKVEDEFYLEDGIPYHFDNEIPSLLQQQIKQIQKGESISLPVNYSIIDSCEGDLNTDGLSDFVVIVEQAPGSYTGSRAIYIFIQDKGQYEFQSINTSLVLGYNEGGVFGDPYSGISINDGKLHVTDYGGSSDRWAHDYEFEFVDNQFILTFVEQINYNTFHLFGTVDYYDLQAKTKVTRTWNVKEETSDNPYDKLLLFTGRIINDKKVAFHDTIAWCENDFEISPNYPMPTLWNTEFGANDFTSIMKYKPEEILDKVQQKYYPAMHKVKLPCSIEIINNYSLLLGYHIPSYYYSDGENNLYYSEFDYFDSNESNEHLVIYQFIQDDYNDSEYYFFSDDTGEQRSIQ
ncbi:MAG: hypothetical protein K0S01_3660 [Herbinix sp.]|jgi:hypothetical protein|nr:hypothetical protein [Herbinix sp.]